MRAILICLFVLPLFVSCKKQISDMADDEERKLAGKYKVSVHRLTIYDSTGKQLSVTETANPGWLELIMNTNEGADVFSHFNFYGPVRNTYVPQRLNKSNYCGEQDAAKQLFGIYYQCDPYKKRLLLAASCPGETVSYYVDYSFEGSSFKFFSRVVDAASKNQNLYEYICEKE